MFKQKIKSAFAFRFEKAGHSSMQGWIRAWVPSTLNGGVLTGRLPELSRPGFAFNRPSKWLGWILLSAALVGTALYEMRTSAFQSQLLSRFAHQMTYRVESGPSRSIIFPKGGPFDQKHGYTQIPDFQHRLEAKGFRVAQQGHFSPELMFITRLGIAPPYREPAAANLMIRSDEGAPLYNANSSAYLFESYEQIPSLIVKTLLLMENRELAAAVDDPSKNPAVEWDRLAKAGLSYIGTKLGLPLKLEGGSTLATQLEKYRHSSNGRTHSALDKLRQMTAASLRVYRSGTDTRAFRREIIVDYLNSVPLAAAPGYGEVNGLGQGLHAWFGVGLDEVCTALQSPLPSAEKARASKQVLSLLASVRAPSYYLLQDRAALESRVLYYARLLAKSGVIDSRFLKELEKTSSGFLPRPVLLSQPVFSIRQKTSNAIRTHLMGLLGVPHLYDLDHLDLEVRTTLDAGLQNETARIFTDLKKDDFLDTHGLRGDRLLSHGDPGKVIYSLMLFESAPQGNILRIQTDNLAQPLDINDGMKMGLGSTAKLRTLAHYLELVASLYYDYKDSRKPNLLPRDPITLWVSKALGENPQMGLDKLLQKALDRNYSASPDEAFFTGGGLHTFHNFDSKDNGRVMSVREAVRRSTNLVFIRLMRDLARFHQARLPYDVEAVLADPDNPVRRRLLDEAAENEAKQILFRAYKSYRSLSPQDIISRVLGKPAKNNRGLTLLFFAWHPGPHDDVEKSLSRWLETWHTEAASPAIRDLVRAYGNPRLTLSDYGHLLRRHPLELWCAGELTREPDVSWDDLWGRSQQARQMASSWLYQTRNLRAQDIRLRIRIEQDAFARMTPYWQKLGFPFERLVASYATAIGNSSDRPAALAKLMGIIVNNGYLRPTIRLQELRFAPGGPYETALEPGFQKGEQVMDPAVALALRGALAEVVQSGTARRLAGAFVGPDGTPIVAGGKTGSGDNRFKSFGRGRVMLASRAVNRTATFVFYIGDHYFGVLSASVLGSDAERYTFTSALPVSILKLLAPALSSRLADQDHIDQQHNDEIMVLRQLYFSHFIPRPINVSFFADRSESDLKRRRRKIKAG